MILPLHESLMDEAFEMGGPADEGDIYGDMDPYDADDYYGRLPCNCPRFDINDPSASDHPGCRKCNPPEFDNRPGIEGIDKYKDPAFLAANAWAWNLWLGGPYRCYEARDVRMALREKRWAETTKLNPKIERAARRKWDRLCDKCQTHGEAIKAYKAWAERAIAIAKAKGPAS